MAAGKPVPRTNGAGFIALRTKTEGNEGVSREGSEGPGENGKTKREAEEEGTRANAAEV